MLWRLPQLRIAAEDGQGPVATRVDNWWIRGCKNPKILTPSIFATANPPVVNSRRHWTLAVLSGYSELGEPPQHPTSFISCVVTIINRPAISLRNCVAGHVLTKTN